MSDMPSLSQGWVAGAPRLGTHRFEEETIADPLPDIPSSFEAWLASARMEPEVVLTSHPSRAWEGARELSLVDTGRMLCTTRNPLHGAALRLLEEGFPPSVVMIIKDANDAAPELRSTIADALALEGDA